MLTEHFLASIGPPTKVTTSTAAKDVGILLHELQPQTASKTVFKKSATPPRCLASNESHVFAAQCDKSVVHVYGRAKGNLEAVVPFTERITCVSLACNDTVLFLGTAEGRIFAWEIATGRQVTTAQSHLQPVTALATDSASTFLLSTSKDSTAHVWSIPSLLSFANLDAQGLSPLHTFTAHNAEIVDVALGHADGPNNIAATVSTDKTCVIWDYRANVPLRTYLLPALPSCLALDAGDRAVFVGYPDGSLQMLDLFADGERHFTSVHDLAEQASAVTPAPSSQWLPPDSAIAAAHCLDVSFDGSTVISGHQSGDIIAWDVARKRGVKVHLQIPFNGPVTNLAFLPVTGFRQDKHRNVSVPNVVKPRFGAFDNGFSQNVPGDYAIQLQMLASQEKDHENENEPSAFEKALLAPSLPSALLDEGLKELDTWRSGFAHNVPNEDAVESNDGFMSLDASSENPDQATMEEQNAELKAQIEALRRVQRASFDKLERLGAETRALRKRESQRMANGVASNGGESSTGSDTDMDDSDSSISHD
ncbi:hypothetical protein MBLNU230_g6987t1 [Neophaeotheca triangularis]